MKKLLVVLLALAMIFAFAACGDTAEPAAVDSEEAAASDFTAPEGWVEFLYADTDAVTMWYPGDQYALTKDELDMDILANADGSMTIDVMPYLTQDEYEEDVEFLMGNDVEDEFSSKDVTLAGYTGVCISYLDSWDGTYCASYCLSYGQEINLFEGCKVIVTGPSIADCTSADIEAIIDTLNK